MTNPSKLQDLNDLLAAVQHTKEAKIFQIGGFTMYIWDAYECQWNKSDFSWNEIPSFKQVENALDELEHQNCTSTFGKG